MFTQIVMFSTISLLFWTGNRIFQRGKEKRYFPAKIFALGLFLIAFGIYFYAIRDIFIQFKMLEIQIKLLMLGGFIQTMGGILIIWFMVKEFVSRSFFKYITYVLFTVWIVTLMFSQKIVPMASELQRAPLEPFPYFVVRNYPTTTQGNIFLIITLILISLLIFGIILYNSLMVKEKELRMKGLFYGLGVLFLIAPMVICTLISPIYARIGYLVGAILIYKTFGIKA